MTLVKNRGFTYKGNETTCMYCWFVWRKNLPPRLNKHWNQSAERIVMENHCSMFTLQREKTPHIYLILPQPATVNVNYHTTVNNAKVFPFVSKNFFVLRCGPQIITELWILWQLSWSILRAVLIVSPLFDLPHLKGLWLI